MGVVRSIEYLLCTPNYGKQCRWKINAATHINVVYVISCTYWTRLGKFNVVYGTLCALITIQSLIFPPIFCKKDTYVYYCNFDVVESHNTKDQKLHKTANFGIMPV